MLWLLSPLLLIVVASEDDDAIALSGSIPKPPCVSRRRGLIVTTLDGQLHAFDDRGLPAWRHYLGEALIGTSENASSAVAPLDLQPRLWPALDGSLFLSRREPGAGSTLEPVRASVRQVVDVSPVKVDAVPNMFLTGERHSEVHTVELPEAGADLAVVADVNCHEERNCKAGRSRLRFGTTRWRLAAVDEESNAEAWSLKFQEISGITSGKSVSVAAAELWHGRVGIDGHAVTLRPPRTTEDEGGSTCSEHEEDDGKDLVRSYTFDSEVLSTFVYEESDPLNASGDLSLQILARAPATLPLLLLPHVSPEAPPMLPVPDDGSGLLPAWYATTRLPGALRLPGRLETLPSAENLSETNSAESWQRDLRALFLLPLALLLILTWQWQWRRLGRVQAELSSELGSKQACADETVEALQDPAPQAKVEPSLLPERPLLEAGESKVPADSPLGSSLRNGQFRATFSDSGLVGVGGFGAVYKARHRLESGWYAVKLVPLDGLDSSEAVSNRSDFSEVSNLRRLADSKHVVRYFTCWCEEPPFLPAEMAEAGGLMRKNPDSPPHSPPGPEPLPEPEMAPHSSSSVAGDTTIHSDRFCVPAPAGAATDSSGASEAYQASLSLTSGEASAVCFEESSSSTKGWAVVEKTTKSLVQKGLEAEKDKAELKRLQSLREVPLEQFQAVLMIQMEFCTGPALRTWLDLPRRHGSSLPQFLKNSKGEALELAFAKHLMKGIREIHAADLVHRDLKPQNLFVQDEQVLKIGDFGLSRRAYDKRRGEGGKVGTPAYCAPEGGAGAGAPADIFSAALVILELLCPPFKTFMERAEVLLALRERRELPKHVEMALPQHAALLRQMAQHCPSDRPSAAEVHAELKQLGRTLPLSPILEASGSPESPPSFGMASEQVTIDT